VNGRPVLSCITLAAEAAGTRVETVESLAEGTELHPLQDAFVRYGAAQCGFCTPGMLMSAKAFVDEYVEQAHEGGDGNGAQAREASPEAEAPSARQAIKFALSGNLCRCTGYTKILDAVEDALGVLRERRQGGGS